MKKFGENAGCMILRNEFFRNGVLAARVSSTAGWLDLKGRKLICPPPELAKLLHGMSRTDDFIVLPRNQDRSGRVEAP